VSLAVRDTPYAAGEGKGYEGGRTDPVRSGTVSLLKGPSSARKASTTAGSTWLLARERMGACVLSTDQAAR